MNKKTVLLALVIPFAAAACAPKKMPPVPLSIQPNVPCAELAPWGFPQAADLPDLSGKKRKSNKKSSVGFICHKGMYAIGYDQTARVPRWVQEIVSPKNWDGTPQKVRKDWRPDPFVAPESVVTTEDYSREITQGRISLKAMASHKNFINDELAVGRTFYLSNSAPFVKKDDHPGAWERLEDQVVAWSAQKQDLLVISGTMFYNGAPIGRTGHKPEARRRDPGLPVIAIPSHFYKVIVDIDTKSAIAFVVPNDDSEASKLNAMARTVQDVELLTGIQFFPSLAPQDRAQIVGKVNIQDWPMR